DLLQRRHRGVAAERHRQLREQLQRLRSGDDGDRAVQQDRQRHLVVADTRGRLRRQQGGSAPHLRFRRAVVSDRTLQRRLRLRETLFWLIFLLSAAAATPPHSSDEVLATVNGVAIRRGDLVKALDDRARQGYVDAADDLRDLEHSAVRDYLGRQAIEREAKETRTTPDAIYDRVLAADYERFEPNLRNRIAQQRERIFTAERQALDELIRKTLLAQAAKAKGMTVEELDRSLANQAPPVTKA